MIKTDNRPISRNRRKIKVKKRVITNDSSDDSDFEHTRRRVRAWMGARLSRCDSEQAKIAGNSYKPSSATKHDSDSEDPNETSSDSVTAKTAVSSNPSDPESSDSVTVKTIVNSSPSNPESKDGVSDSEFEHAVIETSDSSAQESDGRPSIKVVSQSGSASSARARSKPGSEIEFQASSWEDNYFTKYIKTTRSDASSVSTSPIMRTVSRKSKSSPERAELSTSHSRLLPVLSPSRSRPSRPTPTQESPNKARPRSGSSSSNNSESSNSSNSSQRSSGSSSSSSLTSKSNNSSTGTSKSNSSCKSTVSSDSNKSSRRSNSSMSRSSISSNNSSRKSNSSSHERKELSPNRFASVPGTLPVSIPVKLPSSRSNRMPEIVPGVSFSSSPVEKSGKNQAKSHIQINVKIPLNNGLLFPSKTPDNGPLKYPISIPKNYIASMGTVNQKSSYIATKLPHSFPVSIPLNRFIQVPPVTISMTGPHQVPVKTQGTISSQVHESNNIDDEFPVSLPVRRPTPLMSFDVPLMFDSFVTPEEVDLLVPCNSPVSVPDTSINSSIQNSEKVKIVNMSEGSYGDEEVSLVKEVCGKRWCLGSWQYCVKWHGYGTEDDTWEEEGKLECFDHIAAYESNKPPPPPAPAQGTQYENGPHGYERGLPAEKILGASRLSDGQTCYLIKWEGCYEPDWITASQANKMSPQIVINFFEPRYRLALEQLEQVEVEEDEEREMVKEKEERETTTDGKEAEKDEEVTEEKNKKDEFRNIEEAEKDKETTVDEKICIKRKQTTRKPKMKRQKKN